MLPRRNKDEIYTPRSKVGQCKRAFYIATLSDRLR